MGGIRGILIFLLCMVVPLIYEGIVLQSEKKTLEHNLREGIHFTLPGSIGYRFTLQCNEIKTVSRFAVHKGQLAGCIITNDLHKTVLLENLAFDFKNKFFHKKLVLYKEALKIPLPKIDSFLDIKDLELVLHKEQWRLTNNFRYGGVHFSTMNFFSNMIYQVPLLQFTDLTHKFNYRERKEQQVTAQGMIEFYLEAPFKQIVANYLSPKHPMLSEILSAIPSKAKVEGRNEIVAHETGSKASPLPDLLEMAGTIYIDLDDKYTITKEVAFKIDTLKNQAAVGSKVHFEHFMKLIDIMYTNTAANSSLQKSLQPTNILQSLNKWNMIQYDDLNAHFELTLGEGNQLTINGIEATNLLPTDLNFQDILNNLR